MSTNSTIAAIQKDGTVKAVYAHWDGYIQGNGKLLFENHNSEDAAQTIVGLGSISSLDELLSPPEGVEHSFDKPAKGVTTCYGRDRGESDTEPTSYISLESYTAHGDFQEFNYLWRNNKWNILTNDKKWIPLTAKMIESDSINEETEDKY